MKSVISALIEAFKTLLHPKMLALALWPMLTSAALWMTAAFVFWGSWTDALTAMAQSQLLEKWLGHDFSATASRLLIAVILTALLTLAVLLTALVITAVLAMPVIVGLVERKYYPGLERKAGATAVGGIKNTVFTVIWYCLCLMASLPLWFFFPLSVVLPILLTAWLNMRLFIYDALAEHASKDEYIRVVERSRARLYSLGLAAGLLQFVPVLNFFLPLYMGLAFTHLCLGELARARQAP